MHRKRFKTPATGLGLLFLVGCATVTLPELPSNHPANPDAGAAPLPVLARSLQTYDPASAPAPELPDSGMQMDHGSMKDKESTMKGMDHGSMNHGPMKGMVHGSTMAADDSAKKKSDESMTGMDHGSMKGMDPGAHWMAPADAAARKNPVPANAASIERGKKLFEANCATCHGKTGRGDGPGAAALNPKPADLKAMAGNHSDGDYAWKIANGRGAMPAWRGVLDEKQIWDAVNFVQSLGGSKSKAKDTGHDHSKHQH